MRTVRYSFQTLWAHESVGLGLRIFVALSIVSFYCWHHHRLIDLPSFYLGIVACFLGETDDYWWQRLKAVLFLTLCFAITTLAVSIVFPYPVLFVVGMSVSVLGWTLLGSLGERYAAMSTSIVAIAIFSMLNLDQLGGHLTPRVTESICIMLAGSLGYGLLTVVWTIIFANRPVRTKLAQLMTELGILLQLREQDFEAESLTSKAKREFKLSKQNALVMETLDRTYTAIISRFGRSDRLGIRSGLYFRFYALALEAHERIHSFHVPKESLATELFHSDVLFRSQRSLRLLSQAFFDLAQAIRLGHQLTYTINQEQVCGHLRLAIDFVVKKNAHPSLRLQRQLNAFEILYTNLRVIDQRLRESLDSKISFDPSKKQDSTEQTYSWQEICMHIRGQLSPQSIQFRFGLRLAVALAIGYLTIHLVHLAHGYWVLLTIAFVCRPNFGATRLRVFERMAGTLVGLIISWIAIKLFPLAEIQLVFALLGALIFPVMRQHHYIIATTAVTIMAIFCFNLIGNGLLVIWPRLFDTLIGCTIAAVATLVIYPDWQGRRLNQVCGHLLQTCANYLRLTIGTETTDEAQLLSAQHAMHNANAALSAVLTNMIHEPSRYRRNIDSGFHFLALSNTLIGYLMAIGKYRHLPSHLSPSLTATSEYISQSLSALAQAIATFQAMTAVKPDQYNAIAESLDQEIVRSGVDVSASSTNPAVIYYELALVLRLFLPLEECGQTLVLTSLKSPAQTQMV